MRKYIFLLFVTVSIVPPAICAPAAEYNAVILHPNSADGSIAYAVNGDLQVGTTVTSSAPFATVWFGSSQDLTMLHDMGSQAYDIHGNQAVGYATDLTALPRAALWTQSTQESLVWLHPAGFVTSQANAVHGSSQVGRGEEVLNGPSRALLWHGTADSVVNLHPQEFYISVAHDVYGDQQVGVGRLETIATSRRALLWNGSAQNAVLLHPDDYLWSEAKAIWADYQAGRAVTTSYHGKAVIWHGTAESMIDLTPFSSSSSAIEGAWDDYQVGWAKIGPDYHAIVWQGTAESAFDLHSLLPDGYIDSYAIGVDQFGNIVGRAVHESNPSYSHAVLWAIPEPSTLLLLGLGVVMLRKKH